MDKIKLLVILGTDRPDNWSSRAFEFVLNIAKQRNTLDIKTAKVQDLPVEYDSKHPEYSKLTEWADAFFIVTPEYNHGYPGKLKTLIDSEFSNYKYKVAIFAGVSDGGFGGARCIEGLVHVMKTLNVFTLRNDVNFSYVNKLFTKDGIIEDKEKEKDLTERTNLVLDEAVKVAKAVKALRD